MAEYVHKDGTTIHEFITSPSLDPSVAHATDEHGIYPVNPLGFPDPGVCDDDRECLGKGNPEYPQAKNFSVEMGGLESLPGNYVEIATNVAYLSGTDIVLSVDYLESVNGTAGTYRVTVKGNILCAVHDLAQMKFGNAGYEDYSVTGIVGDSSVSIGNAEFSDGKTTFVANCPGCTITGHVGDGRLTGIFDVGQTRFVLLTAQDNSMENGLYEVTGDGEPWVRLASVVAVKGEPATDADDPYNSPASLDNSLVCDHVRHGYSDREVAEYVESKVGEIVTNSIHPMGVPGDLDGAGQITRWFVECGNVELAHSHSSGVPVTVTGFGLGGHFSGDCTYGRGCSNVRHVSDGDGIPVINPVTTFSIGTRRPADGETEDTLPRDWPFRDVGGYDSDTLDNNITLLKKPAQVSGEMRSVWGLRHDVYAVCPKCGGSGEFEGDVCPECDGDGEVASAHSESNRIHVCVNNDFSPNEDGTTTVKKTFIHLPAPINTPDGDEYEVTVSLPVVETPSSYGDDAKKNLSAYYEYVSSPRVIVLGGYWKFSDTRVTWHESKDLMKRTYVTGKIEITGNVKPFVDKDGTPLPVNSRIRFTLDGGMNCPRYTDMKGALLHNETGRVTITGLEGYPYTSRLRDTRMCICGVAYLDPGDDGLSTGTDVPMGLHSRNGVTLVDDDRGSGAEYGLDKYNKFIKPLASDSDTGRKGLCEMDARQVVATVYPTATNTFQWNVVGRHKMTHLDRLMTDEWDIGENSVSAMIWDSNKKVIDFTDTVDFFGYGDGSYGFTAETMPLRYSVCKFSGSNDRSIIGSQLRVKISRDGYREVASNPVRQARKAASMLADDFRKLRMFHGSKLPKITTASGLNVSGEPVNETLLNYFSAWEPDADPSADVISNAIASAAWLSKARHLPEYVIVSGQDLAADGNSLIGADPFVDEPASTRYNPGFAGRKYGNWIYGTKDGHEVIPCNVGLPGNLCAFAYRSIISARVESDPDATKHELYGDANRVAELQKVSIDGWKPGLDYDFTEPYSYLLDSSDYQKWMDIYSATSNVFSIDNVPVPDDCPVPQLYADQKPMVSGDPMAEYNEHADTPLDFVASNLPFYDESSPRSEALTNMLRKLVSPYGSRMPVRFWDGTRVGIARNGVTDIKISLTRLTWPDTECAMSPETRADIIADEFMARSNGARSVDVNLNRVAMESTLHMNWSAPPVKVGRNWYNRAAFRGTGEFAGPSGYVRVFMKFKFSATAGRWYAVDYRQVPMSYLTPLYGANALEERIDGVRVWTESMCPENSGWKDVLMFPYSRYAPMDINPLAISGMVENAPSRENAIDVENITDLESSTVSLPRLSRPYMPVSDGGLGLNAPCDVNGNTVSTASLAAMPHANFWSVRKHLRPAVSVLDGSDIPGVRFGQDDAMVRSRAGGTMGDAVLWGQFAFPRKDGTEYVIPPNKFDDVGDKLVLSTGEYLSLSDGSLVELG